MGSPKTDVFINYRLHDEGWVRSWRLPKRKAAGVSAVDFHNFEPGAPRVDETERAVLESRKTLLILTPDYFTGEWEEFGSILTQTLDPAVLHLTPYSVVDFRPILVPAQVREAATLHATEERVHQQEGQRIESDAGVIEKGTEVFADRPALTALLTLQADSCWRHC